MTSQELEALCNWMMVSDPFPLPESQHQTIIAFLNRSANLFRYNDWVEAYHRFKIEKHIQEMP